MSPLFKILWISFLWLTSSIAAVATQSSASTSAGYLDLIIELSDPQDNQVIDGKTITFKKACESFGVLLSGNKGLWGTGPFRRILCTKGQDKKSNGASKIKEKWTWKLRASATDKTRVFEISYRDKLGNISVASSYTLTTDVSTIFLMNNGTTGPLIAAYLSLGLPFSSTIPGDKIKPDSKISYSGPTLPQIAGPKSTHQIYSLRRSGNLWQPKVVATGTTSEKTPGVISISILPVVPEPGQDLDVINPKGTYFAHQVADRDEARVRINEAITPELSNLFKTFFDIGRSAYLGIRYGMPLGAGSGILAKSPMVGLFGEFRGGVLSGINFNYDVIRKRTLSTAEAKQEYSWSRTQIGYSVGRRINSSYFNWVDLTPKLGVTSLSLTSTPTEDSAVMGYDFRLSQAPTIGAEIGLESRTNTFLYRIWGYAGYSLGVVKIDRKYHSTSTRIGFDIYKEFMEFKTVKLAFLGFGSLDSATYSKILSDEELAANPDETKSIRYGIMFVGGGLTFTW